jgi:hypothetical protein
VKEDGEKKNDDDDDDDCKKYVRKNEVADEGEVEKRQ